MNGKHNYTIADIKRLNKDAGLYFFSRATMKFFATRIESKLCKFGYFITSEKTGFTATTRAYTLRQAEYKTLENGDLEFTGEIRTVGDFSKHSDISVLRDVIRESKS